MSPPPPLLNMPVRHVLETLIKALQNSDPFPYDSYSGALQSASKHQAILSALSGSIPDGHQAWDLPNYRMVDGRDFSDTLANLGVAAITRNMAVNNDRFGFHALANNDYAVSVSRAGIMTMFPWLFADHINTNLRKQGLPELKVFLTQCPGFLDAYNQLLQSPPFDHLALMADDTTHSREYTTTLLFVYLYLNQGNGTPVPLQTSIPSADSPMGDWMLLVNGWIRTANSPDFQKAHPNVRPGGLVSSLSAVIALPDAPPDAPHNSLVKAFAQSVVGDPGLWNITDDLNNLQTMAAVMWTSWDSRYSNFQKAILDAENQSRTEISSASAGPAEPIMVTTTWYGDPALAFIDACRSAGYGAFFSNGNVNRTFIEQQSNAAGGSCFRPGTKVATDKGPINIELITEGTQVVTRVGTFLQYGVSSDEQPKHSTTTNGQRTKLWSFNGETPFFTAGHVFHTATGLRAIDPRIAMLENPWLEVGILQPGHYVLRTTDGRHYDPVLVEKLHMAESDCDFVYGVHLREGLRSYHANGYLVHVNYPEITIKSLSKLLADLSPSTRLSILRSAKELQPILEKFGAHTALDVLNREVLSQQELDYASIAKKGLETRSRLLDIVRRWSLSDFSEGAAAGFQTQLPTLEVCQGVVHVDNEYCSVASINKNKICWVRPMADNIWEHGEATLATTLASGHGSIVYSSSPNAIPSDRARAFLMQQIPITVPKMGTNGSPTEATNAPSIMVQTMAMSSPLAHPNTSLSPPHIMARAGRGGFGAGFGAGFGGGFNHGGVGFDRGAAGFGRGGGGFNRGDGGRGGQWDHGDRNDDDGRHGGRGGMPWRGGRGGGGNWDHHGRNEPDPSPQPVPNPTPIPNPQPQPDPIPLPKPDPQPQPLPNPTPIPNPQPQPDPIPLPKPDPQPQPLPKPIPRPAPAPIPHPVPPPSGAPAMAEQHEPLDHYSLVYDPSDFKDGQTTPSGATMPITDMYTYIDGESGTFLARLAALDAIRDAAAAKLQASPTGYAWKAVPELYSATPFSVGSATGFVFEITNPDIIAAVADGYDSANPRFTGGLTFKNLGLDQITLPFVPSIIKATFSFDALGIDAPSLVREYDPAMIGQIGKRHLLAGTWTESGQVSTMRAMASVAAINGPSSFNKAHVAPAVTLTPLVRAMAAAIQVPADDAAGVKYLYTSVTQQDINQKINEKSQNLLFRTMLYHMDDSDREKFTGSDKPAVGSDGSFEDTEIPASLASLDSQTSGWLRDTYAKAWISQRICGIPASKRKDWRPNFKDYSAARLQYWWSGKGPSCMSKSQEYNRLNQLAANAIVMQLCPQLQRFKDDQHPGTTAAISTKLDTTGFTGGRRWARALFNSYSRGPGLKIMAQDTTAMQKVTTFMCALDPIPISVTSTNWTDDNKPLAIRLSENVRKWHEDQLHCKQYMNRSDEFTTDENAFLVDGMKALWDSLLSDTSVEGKTISSQLKCDLENMLDIYAEEIRESGKDKVLALLDLMTDLIASQANIMKGISAMGTGLPSFLKNFGSKGWLGAWASAEQAVKTANGPQQGNDKFSKAKCFAFGAMVIVSMGMFIGGAWSAYRMWPSLDPTERAKLILSTIQTALVTADQANNTAMSIVRYRYWKNNTPAGDVPPDAPPPEKEPSDAESTTAAGALEESTTQDAAEAEQLKRNSFGDQAESRNEILRSTAEQNGERINADTADDEAVGRQIARDARNSKEAIPSEDVLEGEEKPVEPVKTGPDIAEEPEELKLKLKNFNIAGFAIKSLIIACGIGLTIIGGISLYQNWSTMSTVDRAINVVLTVQQSLSLVVDAVSVGIEVAETAGMIVDTALSTVCAFAGPILAIIGVVLFFVLMLVGSRQPPPQSEPEIFIQNTGQPFVDNLRDPPSTKLIWNLVSSTLGGVSAGQPNQSISISGRNITNEKVKLASISTRFATGSDSATLFADQAWKRAGDTSNTTATGLVSLVGTGDTTTIDWGLSQTTPDNNFSTVSLSLVRKLADPMPENPTDDDYLLIVEPGQTVGWTIVGTGGAFEEPSDDKEVRKTLTVQESWVDDDVKQDFQVMKIH